MDPCRLPEPVENEELLQIYLESGEESVRGLLESIGRMQEDAGSETDLVRLEHLSHRVKGSSYQFGFRRAGEIAERMEALARFLRERDRLPDREDRVVLQDAAECLAAALESIRTQSALPDIADLFTRLDARFLSAKPSHPRSMAGHGTPGADIFDDPQPEVCIDLDQVDGLPALPEVIIRIMELIEDEDVSVNRIAEAVEQDPSLAASVLKIVNSPFYGLSNRITSIRHAVVLLGFRAVRNLAMSAALIRTFGGGREDGRIGRQRLWRHSVACAVGARLLAGLTRAWEPEEAFLAGLMHSMGIVVLEQCFHEEYLRVLDKAEVDGVPFRQAQLAVFGCTDAEVGGRLAGKWNFPASVVDAISRQYDPLLAEGAPLLAAIVHLADRMTPCASDLPGAHSVTEGAGREAVGSGPGRQQADCDPGVAGTVSAPGGRQWACEVWERDALDLRAAALIGLGPGDPERFLERFGGEWEHAQSLLGLVG